MTEIEIHDLAFRIALDTVTIGAPGLKEATRKAIAINIAIKMAHEIKQRLDK